MSRLLLQQGLHDVEIIPLLNIGLLNYPGTGVSFFRSQVSLLVEAPKTSGLPS